MAERKLSQAPRTRVNLQEEIARKSRIDPRETALLMVLGLLEPVADANLALQSSNKRFQDLGLLPSEEDVPNLSRVISDRAKLARERSGLGVVEEGLLAASLPPFGPKRPPVKLINISDSEVRTMLGKIGSALAQRRKSPEIATTPNEIADLLEDILVARSNIAGSPRIGVQASPQGLRSELGRVVSSQRSRLREEGVDLPRQAVEPIETFMQRASASTPGMTERIAEDARLVELVDQLRSGELTDVADVFRQELRKAHPRERGARVPEMREFAEERDESMLSGVVDRSVVERQQQQIADEAALEARLSQRGGNLDPADFRAFADSMSSGSSSRFLDTEIFDVVAAVRNEDPTALTSFMQRWVSADPDYGSTFGTELTRSDRAMITSPQEYSRILNEAADAYATTGNDVYRNFIGATNAGMAESVVRSGASSQLGSFLALTYTATSDPGPVRTNLLNAIRRNPDVIRQFNRGLGGSPTMRSNALRVVEKLRRAGIDPDELGIGRTVGGD